jgi:hypothetical protein
MTQAERDLVALKKAKKKLITQREAAEELGITERHVRRLLHQLKKRSDKAVVHALRGLAPDTIHSDLSCWPRQCFSRNSAGRRPSPTDDNIRSSAPPKQWASPYRFPAFSMILCAK